jgi:hypothetical protein
MALNVTKYVDRVLRLAAQRGIDLEDANVESTLPIALLHLQRQVAESPKRAHLEKTSSALTLTSGAVSLATLTDLPYDAIKSVTHSDGTRVTVLPPGSTLRDLLYPRNAYTYWGVVENGVTLYVYKGEGTAADNGTVTIEYGFIPIISTVPDQLVPDLIEAGLALAAQPSVAE